MFIVVAYDVTDDGRRAKLASEMENFGSRVQRSVFECRLNRAQFAEMKRRIHRLIQPADRVKLFVLCRKDQSRIAVDGPGEVYQDPDYFMV